MNEEIRDTEESKLRVITWKDADQNLTRLAMEMLNSADTMRAKADYFPNSQTGPHPTETPGISIKPGHLDSNIQDRGWWTWGWMQDEVEYNPHGHEDPTEHAGGRNHPLSACCWYSFQNLVRMRLKQARAELEKNLFGQGKSKKKDRTATRNKTPKPRGVSKYNRPSERPQ